MGSTQSWPYLSTRSNGDRAFSKTTRRRQSRLLPSGNLNPLAASFVKREKISLEDLKSIRQKINQRERVMDLVYRQVSKT